MIKPEIGIVDKNMFRHVENGRHSFDMPYYGVGVKHINAIRLAGGIPRRITPTYDTDELDHHLRSMQGLILASGGDIHPSNFGELPIKRDAVSETHMEYDVERDYTELYLAKLAFGEVPLLGICRGMQVVNVARGGTIHQSVRQLDRGKKMDLHLNEAGILTDHRHDVLLDEQAGYARRIGKTTLSVIAMHNQAVADIGKGLVAVGWSTDGLVEMLVNEADEGVELVQWHPEEVIGAPESQALYSRLIDLAMSA